MTFYRQLHVYDSQTNNDKGYHIYSQALDAIQNIARDGATSISLSRPY